MRRVALIISIVLTVISGPFVNAEAQSLSDQQISVIRTNCVSAQSTLQQIQRNEALTRVNRGYEYESLLKLLAAFNSRVALNKLNAPDLLTNTSDMERLFARFQADYIAYDHDLSASLAIKCTEQPVTFYDTLTEARDGRAKLAQDVEDMDDLYASYLKNLDTFASSLSNSTGAQP